MSEESSVPTAEVQLQYQVPTDIRAAFQRGYNRGISDGLKAASQQEAIVDGFERQLEGFRKIRERQPADFCIDSVPNLQRTVLRPEVIASMHGPKQ